MQILIKITNLPEGSSVGPIFNIIPNVGTANPSTAYINDLTGDGVLVIVDDGATSITLQSTGLCTNSVSANIGGIPDSYCFELGSEAGDFVYSEEPQTTEYNGKLWFKLDDLLFGDGVVYFDGTQWVYGQTTSPVTIPPVPSENIVSINSNVSGTTPPLTGWTNTENVPLGSETLFLNQIYTNTYCNQLCLTIIDEFGGYVSLQQNFINFTDGQISSYEYFLFLESGSISLNIVWNPSLERWEAIIPAEEPILIAYLPGNVPAGSSGWVNLEVEDLPFTIYSTGEGKCCNCVTITYDADGTYGGNYTDCNGEEQIWNISEANPYNYVTSFCTSNPTSITFAVPTPEGVEQITSVSSEPCVPETVCDDPEDCYEIYYCSPICASFDGGDGVLGGPFNVTLTPPPFDSDAIRDGRPVYYSAPPLVGDPGFEFYVRWVAANNRWEIRTDLDDASSAYVFLESSELYAPIGTSDEWQCALSPTDACVKFGYGIPTTSYGTC